MNQLSEVMEPSFVDDAGYEVDPILNGLKVEYWVATRDDGFIHTTLQAKGEAAAAPWAMAFIDQECFSGGYSEAKAWLRQAIAEEAKRREQK